MTGLLLTPILEPKRKEGGVGGSSGQDRIGGSEGDSKEGGDGRRDSRERDGRGDGKEISNCQVDSRFCEPDSSNDVSRTPPKELIDFETFATRHGFQFQSPKMM